MTASVAIPYPLVEAAALAVGRPLDSNTQRILQYVAASMPAEIPDESLPEAVCKAVRSSDWNVKAVNKALSAAGPDDLSAYTLRSIASRLRAGATVAEAAAVLSVPERLVSKVAVWLGAVEAWEAA